MAADPRKAFCIDRIFSHLGVYDRGGQFAVGRGEMEAAFLRHPDLTRFCEDASFKTLQAYSFKNSMVRTAAERDSNAFSQNALTVFSYHLRICSKSTYHLTLSPVYPAAPPT